MHTSGSMPMTEAKRVQSRVGSDPFGGTVTTWVRSGPDERRPDLEHPRDPLGALQQLRRPAGVVGLRPPRAVMTRGSGITPAMRQLVCHCAGTE